MFLIFFNRCIEDIDNEQCLVGIYTDMKYVDCDNLYKQIINLTICFDSTEFTEPKDFKKEFDRFFVYILENPNVSIELPMSNPTFIYTFDELSEKVKNLKSNSFKVHQHLEKIYIVKVFNTFFDHPEKESIEYIGYDLKQLNVKKLEKYKNGTYCDPIHTFGYHSMPFEITNIYVYKLDLNTTGMHSLGMSHPEELMNMKLFEKEINPMSCSYDYFLDCFEEDYFLEYIEDYIKDKQKKYIYYS